MTDLQGVVGLMYRADWTRLSLSADVRSESDQDLWQSRVRATRPSWIPETPVQRRRPGPWGGPPIWAEIPAEKVGGYHSWDTRLLIAPGGRYRQEYRDEPSGHVMGSDGERSWIWNPPDQAPPGAVGCAVRTAADVVRRTNSAVSATRSLLDDLRGRSRG